MKPDNAEWLAASPSLLRQLACQLREKKEPYKVVRIEYLNYNHSWQGRRGLVLEVSKKTYQNLF